MPLNETSMDPATASESRSRGWARSRQSLLSSGALSLSQSVWSLAIGFVGVPMTLHGLGYSDYGLYSLAFTVVGMGSFLDLGMGWTLAKFVSEADARNDAAELSAVMRAGLAYHLSFGAVVLAAAVLLPDLVSTRLLRLAGRDAAVMAMVLRIVGFSFLAANLGAFFLSALRGVRRFAAATAIAIAASTVSIGGAAAAARAGLGIGWAARAQLSGAVLGAALGFYSCREFFAGPAGAREVRLQLDRMLSFSFWTYLKGLVQILVLEADKLLVGRWAGPAVLAIYDLPFGIAQKLNFLGGPAVTAIFPRAAVGQGDPDSFVRQYFKAARFLYILTGAASLAVIILAQEFLRAWVGERMALEGTFYLRVFAFGYWIVSMGSLDAGCLEGWNRPRTTFLVTFLALAAGGGVVLACAPAFGIPKATACGVSTWLSLTGLGQMLAWQRVSRYSLEAMALRVIVPTAEMLVLGCAAAASVRGPLMQSRLAGLVGIPILASILALYGLFRAFLPAERVELRHRCLSWIPWSRA